MSSPIDPIPCCYFFSVLYNEDLVSESTVRNELDQELDIQGSFCPTINTMADYYSSEMGHRNSLKRVFYFSLKSRPREDFLRLKLWATDYEVGHMLENKRAVNVDVGLMDASQVLLATMKPYAHRIYLDSGIYAELTYIFKQNQFQNLPWTYPDYASTEISDRFSFVRALFLEHISSI